MTRETAPTMSLVKDHADIADLAGITPMAARLARAFQALLESLSGRGIAISAGSANIARYPEWRIAQNPFGALLRFRLTNGNDEALVHLPGHFISQVVDRHYGGCGIVPARGEFSPAEMRFIVRLGERLVASLEATGWPPAAFSEAQTDILHANWPKSREAVVVQPLTAEGAEIKPAVISMIFATDITQLLSGGGDSDTANAIPPDTIWAARMRKAAMRVQLPARAVLARCEVPFARLITLAPGDVLPLMIPAQIPLTVAGRTFAHGSLGEANGRAALMIEKMEQELDQ